MDMRDFQGVFFRFYRCQSLALGQKTHFVLIFKKCFNDKILLFVLDSLAYHVDVGACNSQLFKI